jgi:hypothetical protein
VYDAIASKHEEAAIVAAMSLNLPNVDIYRCWNHVLQNAKLQLKKFGVSSKSKVGKYLQTSESFFLSPILNITMIFF